jgi:hypothetical protein
MDMPRKRPTTRSTTALNSKTERETIAGTRCRRSQSLPVRIAAGSRLSALGELRHTNMALCLVQEAPGQGARYTHSLI